MTFYSQNYTFLGLKSNQTGQKKGHDCSFPECGTSLSCHAVDFGLLGIYMTKGPKIRKSYKSASSQPLARDQIHLIRPLCSASVNSQAGTLHCTTGNISRGPTKKIS